jgi:hypothetical protein
LVVVVFDADVAVVVQNRLVFAFAFVVVVVLRVFQLEIFELVVAVAVF